MEQHGGPTRVSTEPTERQGHSRMGIASFVIAVLATVVIVALFIVSGVLLGQVLQGMDPQNPPDPQQLQRDLQNSPTAAGLGLAFIGIFGCLFLYLVGFILGIAGLIQRHRRRLFAVLGTVLNGLVLLVMGALVVLGALGAAAGGA